MKFDIEEEKTKLRKLFLNCTKFDLTIGNEDVAIELFNTLLCKTLYHEDAVFFVDYLLNDKDINFEMRKNIDDLVIELININADLRVIIIEEGMNTELIISENQDHKTANLRELIYTLFYLIFLTLIFLDDDKLISHEVMLNDLMNVVRKSYVDLLTSKKINPPNSRGGRNTVKRNKLNRPNPTCYFRELSNRFCFNLIKSDNKNIDNMQLLNSVDLTLLLAEETLVFYKDAMKDERNLIGDQIVIRVKVKVKDKDVWKLVRPERMLEKILDEIKNFEKENKSELDKQKYKITKANYSYDIQRLLINFHGVIFENDLYYNPLIVTEIKNYSVIYKKMQKINITEKVFDRFSNSKTSKYTINETHDPEIISSIISSKSFHFKQEGFYPLSQYEYFTQSEIFFQLYNNCKNFFNKVHKRILVQETFDFTQINKENIVLSECETIKLEKYRQKYDFITA